MTPLQPVQTMYEGAHRFDLDVVERMRKAALRAMERYAPDPATLGSALGLEASVVPLERIHARVIARLQERPLDDYRLDFEDGYGSRSDAEEDAEAVRTARLIGRARDALPAGIGIRVKPLGGATGPRALRTLDVFVTALVEASGELPAGFVATLPKVEAPEQAGAFADALDALESRLGLEAGALRFEFMVELPQIVVGPDGASPLRRVVDAGRGRAIAAHFGTYDYTAACGIPAAHQTMHHPACEFAKQMMRAALAGTGVWLSDGSTNVLPTEPYPDDDGSDAARARANRTAVHAAWRRHYEDVSGSLKRGFQQGWDLHPAQLVTRYAALYAFFLDALDASSSRLRAMLHPHAEGGAGFLDDPATGQALLDFVRRAVHCGAVEGQEVLQRCGLSEAELSAGSFATLLAARSGSRPSA